MPRKTWRPGASEGSGRSSCLFPRPPADDGNRFVTRVLCATLARVDSLNRRRLHRQHRSAVRRVLEADQFSGTSPGVRKTSRGRRQRPGRAGPSASRCPAGVPRHPLTRRATLYASGTYVNFTQAGSELFFSFPNVEAFLPLFIDEDHLRGIFHVFD